MGQTRHNLPSFPTPFVGRAGEIAELSQLLDAPDCRLLTLTGPGGIGKTRLAVEVARGKLDAFPDGVYFVPLQPLQAADQVVSAIIDALAFQVIGNDARQPLLDYLHDQHLLLIMDDFEHVLGSASLISTILAEAPQVKLLITSREILNLRGEWVRQVDGLTYPDNGSFQENSPHSALDLFAESARRLRSDFALDHEYEHVVRICQLVEGMPLGIELAAGWLKALSPAQIVKQMQQSLDFLSATLRDMPERHRSIRAVFDQSWQMLSADEQTVFRKLSVFRGSFALDAAEQVAGVTPVALAGLVDKSLVRMDDGGRYSLHEALLEYAEAQLGAAGESESIRQAHGKYYARFVQEREADVKGRRQLAAYQELATDFANIRAAWVWMIEQGKFDSISHIVECLYRFCINQSHTQDFWTLCQATLDELTAQSGEEPHPVWGQIIVRAVYILRDEKLRSDVERSLALARQRNDVAEIGHSLWALGFMARLHNDAAEALAQFDECLTCYRRMDDPFYIADALVHLGMCHQLASSKQAAHDHMLQSLELRQAIGDKVGQAWSLLFLSESELIRANYAVSEQLAQEALQLMEFNHIASGSVMAAAQLGLLSLLQGDEVSTRYQDATALRIASDRCVYPAQQYERVVAGLVASLSGDLNRGQQLLEAAREAIPGPTDLHYDAFWWFDLWGLAVTNCMAGDYAAAAQNLATLHQYGDAEGRDTISTLTLPVQAVILAHSGDRRHAAELLGLAFTHPKSAPGWMEKWPPLTRLRDDLEAELGVEAYADAWERGASRDLETAVADFLAGFSEDYETGRQQANDRLDEPLTEREREVLALLAQGRSNQQIAAALVIAVGTVKRYVYDICQKLEADNRTHAVARAHEHGLI